MLDEDLKKKMDEASSKIDDRVGETAEKYDMPKWAVWIGGLLIVSAIIKILF